jgi:hypothetical protein
MYKETYSLHSDENYNYLLKHHNSDFNIQNHTPPKEHVSSPPEKQVSSMHTLAFATVPFQKFNCIMAPCESLKAGTVFAELNMPYDKKIIRRD